MDTNLRCILLDDELPGLAYLKLICEQIDGIEVVRAFNDPAKFLEESKTIDYDFCFLDIEMHGFNGLEVASLINKPIVFITAYKEYASDAFDLEAVDYIKKPIQKDRLEKAVQKMRKVISEKREKKEFVQLNTNKGRALVFFDQVIHITTAERDKRDKLLRLADGKELILKNISFDQLVKTLPDTKFCRINKKDIIALNTVRFITNDLVTTNIPSPQGHTTDFILSEIYKDEFLKKVK